MIKSAAIRIGQTIFTGRDHAECIRTSKGAWIVARDKEQGFVTTDGRFVDRFEALRIAEECGQIREKHRPMDRLMSEDLLEAN